MNKSKIFFSSVLLTVCLLLLSNNVQAWEDIISRCSGCGSDARRVVLDGDGNVIAIGTINGSEVVKMSKADGSVIWRFVAYGLDSRIPVEDLALDSNGDVFVVAHDTRTVIKVSGATGTEIWRGLIGVTNPNAFQTSIHAVAVDRDNNVVTAGTVGGLLNVSKLRGTNGTEMWRYEREGDAFKVALDSLGNVLAAGVMNNRMAVVKVQGSDGTLIWQKEVNIAEPGQVRDSAHGLAVGNDGSVIIAGEAMNTVFNKDFTVAKYSSNGTQMWVRQTDGTAHGNNDVANAVVVDKDGDVIAAGKLENDDPDIPGTGQHFRVIKFSGVTGNPLWSKSAQNPPGGEEDIYGEALSLSVNAAGNIVAAGYHGSPSPRFTLVKFWGNTGGRAWRSFSTFTNGSNRANSVVMDANSDVIAAGSSEATDGWGKFTVVKLKRKDGTSYDEPPPPPFPNPNPLLKPVIFIPGITGSRLNIKDTPIELWLGTGTPHDSLSLDSSLIPCPPLIPFYDSCFRPDVDIDGVIREAVPIFEKAKFYKPILDMFRREGYTEEGTRPTLFVFAYDWRKSNTANAIKLKELVTHVRSIHQNSKVNIVTHSMGGLLARTYILDNPSPDLHHIDKLITIAAPWLGSPKTLLTLETGQNLAGLSQILIRENTLKTLVDFYPSVHELMPSPLYFNLGGFPFAEDQWDINGNRVTYENYNPSQMYSLFNNRHQRSLPSSANLIFHNRVGQDDWRGRGFGVQYYHIYGWKDRSETIQQVVAKTGVHCRINPLQPTCSYGHYFDTKFGPGDGTVPVLSATRMTPGETQNYNEENAVVLPVFGDKTEHLELTQNPYVQANVISFLNSSTQSLTKKVNQKDHVNRLNQMEVPITQQAYYLRIGGVTSATLKDEAGNLTYPLGNVPNAGVPEVTSYLLGEDTFLSIMPTNDSYTLTFATGGSPVAIDLAKGTDVETAQAIRYLDLDLPANTNVQLVITPEGVGELQYDSNGDGTFDTPITPTVSVTGQAAQDTDAPVVTFAEAVQSPTSKRVTITVTDSSSGVRSLFYSLNGTNFQPYVEPLNLNPAQTPVVYAFAEDNVANRSGLTTYNLVSPTYEGDVQSRPNGDTFIDSDDIQQIRRFSVGLDQPYQSNEFQRADDSPRSTSGDGFVDSDDVQQARRYSVGLDANQLAGRNLQSGSLLFDDWRLPKKGNGYTPMKTDVRVENTITNSGKQVTVPIRVDTQGNETGFTFSLNYDAARLSNPVVTIGTAGGDVVTNITPDNPNANPIGFSITSFTGETIAAGANQLLVTVRFNVAAKAPAGATIVTFCNLPARPRASGIDPNTPLEQPTFTNGIMMITAHRRQW